MDTGLAANGRSQGLRRVGTAMAVALSLSGWLAGWAGLAPGWRFVNPLPQGNSLEAAWAAAPDDLFVGGEGGVIMRWDGATWTLMDTPTQKTILALRGTSASDVWAVGGDGYAEEPGEFGLILHFDGATWSEMAPPGSIGSFVPSNGMPAATPCRLRRSGSSTTRASNRPVTRPSGSRCCATTVWCGRPWRPPGTRPTER